MQIIADWGRARRATGYRVKVQGPGEAEARVFGLLADDQATPTELPVGAALTVTIVAHNGSGTGPGGTPVIPSLCPDPSPRRCRRNRLEARFP